ncbi:MAG: hypothetical protein A2Y33_12555 [Spirochaetes bacterium GWF1_51_8]|nr:MAG: hypothetical protein A2Y33_12555 [Spirochaetes bacterium GWF1_51_8]
MIDSSILIEFIRGGNTILLETLIDKPESRLFINPIIYSEFMFHYISIISGKSPLTLKNSKLLNSIVKENEPFDLIKAFSVTEISEETVELSYRFIRNYLLLPNDSIILANCITSGIEFLASLDSDFISPCAKEKIKLIRTLEDIQK